MRKPLDIRPLGDWSPVNENGDGWVRLDTGDSGLVVAFNPSDGLLRPSMQIGVAGVVDDEGAVVQVVRYDIHEGDPHVHLFVGDSDIRVPLHIRPGQLSRVHALVGVFATSVSRLYDDLVAVGHRAIVDKLDDDPRSSSDATEMIVAQIASILEEVGSSETK